MSLILSPTHPLVKKHITKAKKPKTNLPFKSDLEEQFAGSLRVYGHDLPQPAREYKFHPTRRWRIDFAWPSHKLAVEIEGGIWDQGGHNRALGFLEDIEKYNALTEAGWRLLRFAQPHVEEQPFAMIETIKRCLTTHENSQGR